MSLVTTDEIVVRIFAKLTDSVDQKKELVIINENKFR